MDDLFWWFRLFKKHQQTHLCENAVLSVVLLQDVLEGKLDLLLELLHLHLLLEPGSIWRVKCHVSFFFFFFKPLQTHTPHVPYIVTLKVHRCCKKLSKALIFSITTASPVWAAVQKVICSQTNFFYFHLFNLTYGFISCLKYSRCCLRIRVWFIFTQTIQNIPF